MDIGQTDVRPITLSDVEGFHRAVDLVGRERRYLTMLEAPPLADSRDFVAKLINDGDPAFVAMADDEIVGWCDIRRHFFPANAHRGTLGMGIVPAWRGKGLGPRLIKAALTRARHVGLTRIELVVRVDNARAIALYEKVGFVREGIVRDAALIDGIYTNGH